MVAESGDHQYFQMDKGGVRNSVSGLVGARHASCNPNGTEDVHLPRAHRDTARIEQADAHVFRGCLF